MQYFRKYFLTGFFCLINLYSILYGQDTGQPKEDNYISYPEFFDLFERKTGIRVFYDPVIFQNNNINLSTLELSKEEVLERISRMHSISYLLLQENKVVFIAPRFLKAENNVSGGPVGRIVIGDMQHYGKSPVAKVTGVVRNGKTQELLPGAVVFTEEHNLGSVTNAKGYFEMNLPVGEYDLTLSYIGFESRKVNISVLSSGDIELELFESSVELEEVTIISELTDNIRKSQMSVVEMNARNIRELPLMLGEKDVIKSIAYLPGVQSAGEFGTGFNVRGGSSDQNLVLLEGAPLFNSSHLFGLLSIVNSDMISDVTLLKAGIPAEYGERASSILDIHLGPEIPDKFNVKGGIGILNSRLNMNVPLANRKVGLLLGGRSSYSNWLLERMPDIDLMNSEAGFYDVSVLLTIDPGPRNKLSAFYYKSQDQFSLNNETDYQYSSELASLKWNYIPGDKLSMNTTLAYSNFENYITESDSLERANAYQIYSDLDYYSLKWSISLSASEKHLLKFGFNGIFYDINPGELVPFGAESTVIPKNSRYESGLETAVYFSDDYSLSERLKLKAGLRFSQFLPIEHIEKYKPETAIGLSGALGSDSVLSREYKTGHLFLGPEPRIALRYSLNNQSSLKFSYSRMYQYINLLSNTTVAAPSDLWKLSDAGLPPFVSDQVSLGYYLNLQGNTVELSAEGFFKRLRNIPEYKNGARLLLNDDLENDLLDARGHAYGLELFVKKASGRLTGWVSYTWSRSLRRTNSGIEDEQINSNEYFPSYFDKPHNLATIANFHITRRWRISSTFSYSTGRPVTLPELKYEYNGYQLISYSDRNEYRLPDYHRLDLALTFDESLRIRKRWKGSWTLSLINVYGRKNIYSVFYQKDQASYDNTNKPFNLYKMYIIGQPLPTLTYNMSF